jgi:DNA-binding CsgD family transcriptional regulator
VGIISLVIAVSALAKTQEKLIKYFLLFWTAFTLSVGANLLLAYIHINAVQVSPILFEALDYLEAFIAKYFLMFSIPVFVHYLIAVPNMQRRNRLFGIITLCTFSIHHYFEYITDSERIELIGDFIDRTVFFSVLIYALILGIQKYRTIQDEIAKSTAKKMLILIAILMPGLLHDIYLVDYSSIRFFPLLYGGFSIIFILHFSKRYLHIPQTAPPATFDFSKYNISAREMEIVLLILKGYSNQKIGKELFISLNTVKSHVRHIFEKFQVQSRFELISLFKHSDIPQD